MSKPNQAHKVHPYLLRNLLIGRPNEVWSTDMTYIPMAKGFVEGVIQIVCLSVLPLSASSHETDAAIMRL
jgi:hypothetical protein